MVDNLTVSQALKQLLIDNGWKDPERHDKDRLTIARLEQAVLKLSRGDDLEKLRTDILRLASCIGKPVLHKGESGPVLSRPTWTAELSEMLSALANGTDPEPALRRMREEIGLIGLRHDGCLCARIQADDPRRHFQGCPHRKPLAEDETVKIQRRTGLVEKLVRVVTKKQPTTDVQLEQDFTDLLFREGL